MPGTPPFALTARAPADPEPDLTPIVVMHRAIRQDLARLTGRLGQITGHGMPAAQADAICRYTTALLAQISAHHQNQAGILWPLIAATAEQCVDLTPLTDDHQAIEAAQLRARRALAAFGGSPAVCGAELRAAVSELRDMLDEHIPDEQNQIFPVMRRYLPAPAYRWCEEQALRSATLASRRFAVPWLARFAEPIELDRMPATRGRPGQLLLAATRPGYARLERHVFGHPARPGHDLRR